MVKCKWKEVNQGHNGREDVGWQGMSLTRNHITCTGDRETDSDFFLILACSITSSAYLMLTL